MSDLEAGAYWDATEGETVFATYEKKLADLRLELLSALGEAGANLDRAVKAEAERDAALVETEKVRRFLAISRKEGLEALIERDAFAKQRDTYAEMAFEASGYAQEQNQMAAQAIAERDAALSQVERMRVALEDAMSSLDYVRYHYGDLYGVGFDRVRDKGDAALTPEETTP